MTTQNSVASFYDGWHFANQRLIERIGALSPDQLALRAAPNLWPIWAITAHTAGVRPYWLCHICKEPGAERTRQTFQPELDQNHQTALLLAPWRPG